MRSEGTTWVQSIFFYGAQNTNKIILLISANRPLTIEELRDSISSELEGNPPLWITRRPGKYGVNVYINNAMILLEQSNFQSKLKVNGDTMTQVSISHEKINKKLEYTWNYRMLLYM